MKKEIFNSKSYLIEVMTPKQSIADFESALARFKNRYLRVLDSGCVVSIPDNPLGNLHFTATEIVSYLELAVDPESLLIHLNSFHRKIDLDDFLATCSELGVKYLLCVSGDGSPRLPRLEPADLAMSGNTVTSVELIKYINAQHPGLFTIGAAFNQYESLQDELFKLGKKREAGAEFVITQPVLGGDNNIEFLADCGLPFYPGSWMSGKIELLNQCVGRELSRDSAQYNPWHNLEELHESHPHRGLYLSLLSFNEQWENLLPSLKEIPINGKRIPALG